MGDLCTLIIIVISAYNYNIIIIVTSAHNCIAQLAGAVEYTNCISTDGKTPPTSVLDMTLNNLIEL